MAKKTDEITPPKMNILAQYVRDLSFENILAQKGVDGELNPEIQVNVNIDAKKRTTDKQFDVIIKLRVDSKSKNTNNILFVLELDYGGVFQIVRIVGHHLVEHELQQSRSVAQTRGVSRLRRVRGRQRVVRLHVKEYVAFVLQQRFASRESFLRRSSPVAHRFVRPHAPPPRWRFSGTERSPRHAKLRLAR